MKPKFTSTKEYIFVYGTLKNSAHNSQYFRLDGKTIFIAEAEINGQLFDLGQYPGFILNNLGKVKGELYEVTHSELIAELDDYEGCGENDIQPHEYRREAIEITAEGKSYLAWVYIYQHPVEQESLIESGCY